MTKPTLSSDALRAALKLAKNGALEEAQAKVAMIERESLPTEDLRSLALVHSYCGREDEAEQVWERICARDDVGIGDCFMLANTQMGLGHSDQAVGNLRREIARSDTEGNLTYLSVSAINLAFLLAGNGPKSKAEALEVLNRLGDSEGTYVRGFGQVTKRDLLEKLGWSR